MQKNSIKFSNSVTIAEAQASESLLADVHEPIRTNVLPATASIAIDAVNTQILSVPIELHEVIVLYDEYLS